MSGWRSPKEEKFKTRSPWAVLDTLALLVSGNQEPANSSTEAANKQTSGVPQGGPNVHPHSHPPSRHKSDWLIEDQRGPVCFWEEPFVPLGQQLHVELHIMSAW
ncbi:hypothetical protein Q8A67_014523 [Cirrhinus molitorella]|uniref:Uncharacterized protein n=1 Tax=Cirrhinus molitorella TaxID=172907 RepID=A0AA88PKG4_9TELE|nr:hypothetical protein Q8A67_014523 [Cirrhinus molitorella]